MGAPQRERKDEISLPPCLLEGMFGCLRGGGWRWRVNSGTLSFVMFSEVLLRQVRGLDDSCADFV